MINSGREWDFMENTKNKDMYGLNRPGWDKFFESIDELADYVLEQGVSPHYEITYNGENTKEVISDFLVE